MLSTFSSFCRNVPHLNSFLYKFKSLNKVPEKREAMGIFGEHRVQGKRIAPEPWIIDGSVFIYNDDRKIFTADGMSSNGVFQYGKWLTPTCLAVRLGSGTWIAHFPNTTGAYTFWKSGQPSEADCINYRGGAFERRERGPFSIM